MSHDCICVSPTGVGVTETAQPALLNKLMKQPLQSLRLSRMSVTTAVMAVLWGLATAASQGHAEEPYQRFLQKLRDEQLFDLALTYLSDLEAAPQVSRQFKSEIDLERGLLRYQSAATLSPQSPLRPGKLNEAESNLRKFLADQKDHPRRGEARLKLGELLLTRAEEAKLQAGPDTKDDIPDAIKFYDDAHQLFEATIQELAGILEKMKGARIDPSDTAKVAIRRRVQQDLRQAQLLSGKAVDDRGRSRAEDNPARKADLEKALKMFSDLYAKEQRMIGVRNYALFYRSSIQVALGRPEDAIDGFQRIADQENVDILRPLQTDSVTELIQLLAQQGKYPVAVDRADKWLSGLRPDERNSPETMTLKLELAKLRLAWSEALKKKDPSDRVASRLVRSTRDDLRSMLRVAGGHLEQTRELLAGLGVENVAQQSTELPEVKDFEEAFAAAQIRLDRSETASLGLAVVKEQIADPKTSAETQASLAEQLQTAEAAIDADQRQALQLLREALRLFNSEDDRSRLYDARFRIAYLLLKQQRPWDAMTVAEFLARSAPGTEQGLRATNITLGGFSDLLRTASGEEKAQLTDQLEPFAEYLVQTWPQSAEASAAAAALVQLALIDKQWDKAERFLQLVPATSGNASQLRRDAGISFYANYLAERKAAGEETEATAQLRTRAIESLEQGIQDLTPDELNASAIEAIGALVRLMLNEKRDEDAAKQLFDSELSPIKALRSKPDLVPAKVAMETYRTAIQVVISRLASGKIPANVAVQQTRSFVKLLQDAAAAQADGQRTLADIFVSLASDLKEKLSATQAADERKKLSEALVVVAAEAAKSEVFNTQYWAADTLVSIAEELAGSPAGAQPASQAFAEAANVLEGILAKEKSQPGWIQPDGFENQIRLLLARATRGLGNYKAAINVLAAILQKNNSLLDVQMEAARTYQAWGDATNSGFHKAAIAGGRPDPKTRQPLLWGWGKISQMVANNPNFTDQFYEARYQLAYSRYKYARGLQNAEQKSAQIRKAEKDITSTATLYPELGGDAMRKKYEDLLRVIQKALGKPTTGLAALNK